MRCSSCFAARGPPTAGEPPVHVVEIAALVDCTWLRFGLLAAGNTPKVRTPIEQAQPGPRGFAVGPDPFYMILVVQQRAL